MHSQMTIDNNGLYIKNNSAAALRRAGPASLVGSTVELTLVVGAWEQETWPCNLPAQCGRGGGLAYSASTQA